MQSIQKRNGAKFAVTELLTNPPDVEKLQQDSIASQSAKRPHTIVSYQEPPNKKVNINPDSASSNNEPLMWQRLIGSLNIQAMATRPTMKPLKYQEKLKLKRITTKTLLWQIVQ